MHILPPLLLLTSLSSTLASPLAISPPDAFHAWIEKLEKSGVNNRTCPADRVKAAEKLVFESTIDEFEAARNTALEGRDGQCLNWRSDDCTMSLDKPFGCNFEPPCHRHDFAWNNFRDLHVYTESMKKRVEGRFKQDMMDVCNSKKFPQKQVCKGTARAYAWTVKIWPANKATDSGP